MKIKSTKSNVSFQRSANINKPVLEGLRKQLRAGEVAGFVNKVKTATKALPGEDVYSFNQVQIQRNRQNITLFGEYLTPEGIKKITLTVNRRLSIEKIRGTFARYTAKLLGQQAA